VRGGRHASVISARRIIVLVLMFSFDVTLYNGRESEIMAGFNFARSLRVLWTPSPRHKSRIRFTPSARG
jgi:hypothetical protein